MSITADTQKDLGSWAQLCCSVLDSIGGAESYSVSVSWVGSPANVQGFDSVPAPQSQKNLQVEREKKIIKANSYHSLSNGVVALISLISDMIHVNISLLVLPT